MSTRRTATPTIPSRTSQAAFSLEEWELKAPLGDLQNASILKIKQATEHPPLPLRFSNPDAESGPSTSRPSTPLSAAKLQAGSRPATPTRLKQPGQSGLLPNHPIMTPQQFYDWYTLIERSVAHSQDAHFRTHVSLVTNHLETCDLLVGKIDDVEKEVESMLEGWRSVEEGGRSLKESCERVLDERDRILNLEKEISSTLIFFQELERATRMLNHPGESLVLQADFLYMVETVDDCIEYLKNHRHFREAELYLLRYTQCLTRAMTLIKMYFVGSLRAMSSDITRRLSENNNLSQPTTHHLLYTRFLSLSLRQPTTSSQHTPSSLPPLLRELEKRAASHPDTLDALLAECHAAYIATRKGIVGNIVREEVRSLTRGVEKASGNGNVDVVELTRAGCSYLKQLCTDEFELFKEFFTTGEDLLYEYLETLCDYLYDDLRPRILHEPRLTALCEVCTVLQALMVLDVDVDDVEDLSPTSPRKESRLHISQLLQMILQDAQTRLFFKAQAVVQSDIRHYVPSKEDLLYPERLLKGLEAGAAPSNNEKRSISHLWTSSSASSERQETWYPTVSKTVWVLEQLHEFVNPAIFEDIAQEAIILCHGSLRTASDAILVSAAKSSTSSHPVEDVDRFVASTSALDAYLFNVRHLLILKDVPDRFGLETSKGAGPSEKPSNFSSFVSSKVETSVVGGVADTLTSLLSFAGSDVDGKRTVDSTKRTINQSIRLACENVISTCAEEVCKPLRVWVEGQDAAKQVPSVNGKEQVPREDIGSLPDICASFKWGCETYLRAMLRKVKIYLGETEVDGIVTKHIQERIEEDYGWFRQVAWGLKRNGKIDWTESDESPLDESALKKFLSSLL